MSYLPITEQELKELIIKNKTMSLITEHYNHYLEKAQLKEEEMSDVQKIETKRAFAAGMSEMFVTMMYGLKPGVTLEHYKNEMSSFWKKEVETYNKNQNDKT